MQVVAVLVEVPVIGPAKLYPVIERELIPGVEPRVGQAIPTGIGKPASLIARDTGGREVIHVPPALLEEVLNAPVYIVLVGPMMGIIRQPPERKADISDFTSQLLINDYCDACRLLKIEKLLATIHNAH